MLNGLLGQIGAKRRARWMVAAPVIACVLVFGLIQSAAIEEDYRLEGGALSFAKSCKFKMGQYKFRFEGGASPYASCSCMALNVSNTLDNPNWKKIKRRYSQFAQINRNYSERETKYLPVSSFDSFVLGDRNLEALRATMDVCTDREAERAQRPIHATPIPPAQATTSDSCVDMPAEKVARMEALAHENDMRFDRSDCTMVKL